MTITNTTSNFRYPTSPDTGASNFVQFPSDLITGERNFYMSLQMQKYSRASVFAPPVLSLGQTLTLPIPQSLNDQTIVTWEQESLTSLAASAGSSIPAVGEIMSKFGAAVNAAGTLAAYATGQAMNPFLVMLFKQQNFKRHIFLWTLAPQNKNDANSLQNIAYILKNGMLPVKEGLLMGYPMLVTPYLSVGSESYTFKPCAILGCSIEWHGSGFPAYFEDNSPAFATLSLSLVETELWWQGDVPLGGQL